MPEVLKVTDAGVEVVTGLLSRYGLECVSLGVDEPIPGSYWGDSEAGLVGAKIYWRPDTPLHSLLHEASHFICMDDGRREQLDKDAGGDYDEENGVCYLQILLADELPGVGRERMCQDMDAWGYTFRLGSARAWFEQDADDARAWLVDRGVIDDAGQPTWRKR
ncbi:hypothetical protein JM946_26905 [Steroidobacter sp. S1-65]|uniref:ImmA/IrrE family metallo-endopeptidase n=1 Tax=Steroidobacter gossypii TaxID=2805490 RepID=A0ABS1X573_9GAMM|nr:hypothetical protein [Steroidobacter gossypii]MBM0108378.1 hypothetical protein [Steroidobacter gossypii]